MSIHLELDHTMFQKYGNKWLWAYQLDNIDICSSQCSRWDNNSKVLPLMLQNNIKKWTNDLDFRIGVTKIRLVIQNVYPTHKLNVMICWLMVLAFLHNGNMSFLRIIKATFKEESTIGMLKKSFLPRNV